MVAQYLRHGAADQEVMSSRPGIMSCKGKNFTVHVYVTVKAHLFASTFSSLFPNLLTSHPVSAASLLVFSRPSSCVGLHNKHNVYKIK